MKVPDVPSDVFVKASSIAVVDGHITATCPYCLHHVEARWLPGRKRRLELTAHRDDCLHHADKLCPASRQHFPVSEEAG